MEKNGPKSDYLQCLKFSLFRRGDKRAVLSSDRNMYLDPELESALTKIERRHITLGIFLAGFCIVVLGTFYLAGSHAATWAAMAWIAVDLLIINPVIYMKMCPRPLRDHMKHVDLMDEEEKAFHDEKTNNNESTDRLMKKYRPIEERNEDEEGS